MFKTREPDGLKWNLQIMNDFHRHCYLEGCYEFKEDAEERGRKLQEKSGVRYTVMTEKDYIASKNPYFPEC